MLTLMIRRSKAQKVFYIKHGLLLTFIFIGSWTDHEDKIVIELVEKHGPQKWTFIADHLPGRIGKQCRERFSSLINSI